MFLRDGCSKRRPVSNCLQFSMCASVCVQLSTLSAALQSFQVLNMRCCFGVRLHMMPVQMCKNITTAIDWIDGNNKPPGLFTYLSDPGKCQLLFGPKGGAGGDGDAKHSNERAEPVEPAPAPAEAEAQAQSQQQQQLLEHELDKDLDEQLEQELEPAQSPEGVMPPTQTEKEVAEVPAPLTSQAAAAAMGDVTAAEAPLPSQQPAETPEQSKPAETAIEGAGAEKDVEISALLTSQPAETAIDGAEKAEKDLTSQAGEKQAQTAENVAKAPGALPLQPVDFEKSETVGEIPAPAMPIGASPSEPPVPQQQQPLAKFAQPGMLPPPAQLVVPPSKALGKSAPPKDKAKVFSPTPKSSEGVQPKRNVPKGGAAAAKAAKAKSPASKK